VALDSLAHEASIALCNYLFRCLNVYISPSYTAATCVANEEKVVADQLVAKLNRAIAAGHASYDPLAWRSCLDVYPQLACDDTNEAALAAACAKAMQGTVVQGGACDDDLECADSVTTTYCASDGTCPGHCQARGTLGQTCSSNSQCQVGLECNSNANACATRLAQGAACDPNSTNTDCGGVTSCHTDAATGASSCSLLGSRPTVGEGQDCTGGNVSCATGLVCMAAEAGDGGSTTYRCQQPATSGGPCRYGAPNPCPQSEYCPVSAPSTAAGTCTPRLGPNQACTGTALYECQDGTTCNSAKVCTTIQHIGGSCAANAECYSNLCQNGTCALQSDCAG
jgi:hypothetical protein